MCSTFPRVLSPVFRRLPVPHPFFPKYLLSRGLERSFQVPDLRGKVDYRVLKTYDFTVFTS